MLTQPFPKASARCGAPAGPFACRPLPPVQREAQATGKGSFAWAWMLDERPEERERDVEDAPPEAGALYRGSLERFLR